MHHLDSRSRTAGTDGPPIPWTRITRQPGREHPQISNGKQSGLLRMGVKEVPTGNKGNGTDGRTRTQILHLLNRPDSHMRAVATAPPPLDHPVRVVAMELSPRMLPVRHRRPAPQRAGGHHSRKRQKLPVIYFLARQHFYLQMSQQQHPLR